MRWKRVLNRALVFVLVIGVAMRWASLPYAGWVIGGAASALVFLFLLPIMGERARQPSDAPERKVTWVD